MQDYKKFYQQKYQGSLFVIKAGGRVITDDHARLSLLANIQDLTDCGIRVLLIYGGGHAIDDAMDEAGITPRKMNGRRITTSQTINIVKNVLAGDLGHRIARTMADLNLDGLCLGSIPFNWIDIKLRDRDDPEDFGHDGTVEKVHGETIFAAFRSTPFIACPCLGINKTNTVNINADDVAVAIAAGCPSRKLFFLSDVDGVLIDGKTASFITDAEIPALIEKGIVNGGMQVKLENCLYALQNGVRRIHLLNGFKDNALIQEVYQPVGPATMIIREADRESYLREIAQNE